MGRILSLSGKFQNLFYWGWSSRWSGKTQSGRYLFIEKNGKWDLPKGSYWTRRNPQRIVQSGKFRRNVVNQSQNHPAIRTELPYIYVGRYIHIWKRRAWFLMSYDDEIIFHLSLRRHNKCWLDVAGWISKIKNLAWVSFVRSDKFFNIKVVKLNRNFRRLCLWVFISSFQKDIHKDQNILLSCRAE